YRSNARFCSRICQAIGHAKEMGKPQERQCRLCGKVFIVEPSNTKIYCSRDCASKAHGPKVTGQRISTLYNSSNCPACGKQFSSRATLNFTTVQKTCAKLPSW